MDCLTDLDLPTTIQCTIQHSFTMCISYFGILMSINNKAFFFIEIMIFITNINTNEIYDINQKIIGRGWVR